MELGVIHFSTSTATWLIGAAAIACVLARPAGLPEALWACGGAALLVASGLLPARTAGAAIGKGLDVYLFLAGMMLLSELARREGVFDWCASRAVRAARGSPRRLFFLIYGVGVVVTTFLSNDATAVVMTPAVYAAAKRAGVAPLPHLFACALVANAASFVLPISNPANLVLFGGHLPRLADWLRIFAAPSLVSILVTAAALYAVAHRDLRAHFPEEEKTVTLTGPGRWALGGIGLAAIVALACSAFGRQLGAPTLGAAGVALGLIGWRDRRAAPDILRRASWSILPLVAGLFVIVEALNRAGALAAGRMALAALGKLPAAWSACAGALGIALLSNLMNNLPSGLLCGEALRQTPGVAQALRNSLLIGVDLGPNLSVTGSLATVLWLIALRREGEHVGFWSFFKVGLVAAPPALLLAVLALGR